MLCQGCPMLVMVTPPHRQHIYHLDISPYTPRADRCRVSRFSSNSNTRDDKTLRNANIAPYNSTTQDANGTKISGALLTSSPLRRTAYGLRGTVYYLEVC